MLFHLLGLQAHLAVTGRSTQSATESQARMSNVSVLKTATPPALASSPQMDVNLGVAALLDAAGDVRPLGNGGLPVGLIPGAHWDRLEITLAPGDRLFLMSDGLTECPDPLGRELGTEP